MLSLTRKEIRQLLRDQSNLAIGIGLPIVLILIFGYGLSLDVTNAPVAVVLEDPSPMAADVVAGLELSAYISPVVVSSMHDAERLMLARRWMPSCGFPMIFPAAWRRAMHRCNCWCMAPRPAAP